jgi:RNA polymerase sigma-70 factor, ECF subfamily
MIDAARTWEGTLEQLHSAEGREAALVRELQAGSEDAYRHLLAVYQNPVYHLVSHLAGNPSDAADVLQNVFVKVFRNIRSFHGSSSLKTWIYRIAVHESSNYRRGWLRRRVHEVLLLDEQEVEIALEPQAGDGTPTPYEQLERAEREAILKRALASIPEPYRAVIFLREIDGLSYEDTAKVLEIPEGTVKSRLMRGRQLLRRKLAPFLAEPRRHGRELSHV